MLNTEKQLRAGLDELNIKFEDAHIQQCLFLLDQLILWSKKINLTAITKPGEVVTKHLLDSLAILPLVQTYIEQSGEKSPKLLDVGTGAGFPSLPLAIFTPEVEYHPLDSNSKKLAFIRRVANQLKLLNVQPIHSRIQDVKSEIPYSIVTARAFADINDLLVWLPTNSVDESTQVLAMKGKVPEEELSRLKQSLFLSEWRLDEIVALDVPGLNAERCALLFSKI